MGEIVLVLENYSIYKNDEYYICVSNRSVNNYQMFIGFPSKDFSVMTDREIIEEITKVSDLMFSRANDVIYVLPIISVLELENAAIINDDRKYNKILEKIRIVTFPIYRQFSSMGKRINDVISMVRQNDVDKKIINWIDMKLKLAAQDNLDSSGGYINDFVQEVDVDILKENKNIQSDNQVLEYNLNHQSFESGIKSISREYDMSTQSQQNVLVKRLTKPDEHSHGFSSMKFIVMVLSVALLVGVGVAAWLIK